MKSRKSENNFISGDDGYFDPFFTQLRATLLGSTAEASVDEIGQSIFSLSSEGGQPVGSGFLLGDTGLLVTDSSILAGLGQGFRPGVKAEVRPFAGGPQRQAKLVVSPETVLDYAMFKIPGMLEASPLELADDLPTVGEPVMACISVVVGVLVAGNGHSYALTSLRLRHMLAHAGLLSNG